MKVLLIEDDERLCEALEEDFTDRYYTVDLAYDGQQGLSLASTYAYDLIVLDIMLPEVDGITVCQSLRSQRNMTPILVLTARDTTTDTVIGLDAGADDYVVKPFELQALAARMRALLRRGSAGQAPVLEWEGIQLDPSSCDVRYGDTPLSLTPKEYNLLELLLRNGRRVLSRSQILDRLWTVDGPPEEGTVKAHIKGLRRKLKAAGVPSDPIETVYGLGYRLKTIERST